MEREYMTQEQIEETFLPTLETCPFCGEHLYYDDVKNTKVCLECNYERTSKGVVLS